MSATALDLVIQQGDDWSRIVPVVDANGDAVNITGFTAAMMIRPFAGSGVVILSLTSSPAAGIVITNAAGGILTVTITHTQTAALWAQPCVYDLDIADGSGTITRLLAGNVTIVPAVTR